MKQIARAHLPVTFNRVTAKDFRLFQAGWNQTAEVAIACALLKDHVEAMNVYMSSLEGSKLLLKPLTAFDEDEEIIVGTWGFFAHSQWVDYGWVSYMFIHPAHRRKALGLSIINALVKAYGRVHWECFSGNKQAMLFYKYWKMIPSFTIGHYMYCADAVIPWHKEKG